MYTEKILLADYRLVCCFMCFTFVVCERISAVYSLELQCFCGYIDITKLHYSLAACAFCPKAHRVLFFSLLLYMSQETHSNNVKAIKLYTCD